MRFHFEPFGRQIRFFFRTSGRAGRATWPDWSSTSFAGVNWSVVQDAVKWSETTFKKLVRVFERCCNLLRGGALFCELPTLFCAEVSQDCGIGGKGTHGAMPQAHLPESPASCRRLALRCLVPDDAAADGEAGRERECSEGCFHLPLHSLSPSTSDLQFYWLNHEGLLHNKAKLVPFWLFFARSLFCRPIDPSR
jgi:hypothetical protein